MKFQYSLQVMTVALGMSVAASGVVYAQASDAPASKWLLMTDRPYE